MPLCYKSTGLRIGQNSRAVCTNKGGHRDAFSHEWREVLRILRGLLNRPPSLERRERRGGLFFVIPVNSPVDSTFEQSENIALAHFLVVSLSSCYWPAVRGVAYAILGFKFIHYCLHMRTDFL